MNGRSYIISFCFKLEECSRIRLRICSLGELEELSSNVNYLVSCFCLIDLGTNLSSDLLNFKNELEIMGISCAP